MSNDKSEQFSLSKSSLKGKTPDSRTSIVEIIRKEAIFHKFKLEIIQELQENKLMQYFLIIIGMI